MSHKPQRIPPVTPQTVPLHDAWPRLNSTEKAVLSDMHRGYETGIRDKLAQYPAEPEAIAHSLNLDIDDHAQEQRQRHPRGSEVKCRRGCSACCSMHVSITQPEAVLLARAIREDNIPIDSQRLTRQAERRGLRAWETLSPEDRRCVLLSDQGECMAYEYRPSACRLHSVISDPADCDTVTKPGHRVLQFVTLPGEVIRSAALTVMAWGSMAAMLKAAMTRDEGA